MLAGQHGGGVEEITRPLSAFEKAHAELRLEKGGAGHEAQPARIEGGALDRRERAAQLSAIDLADEDRE